MLPASAVTAELTYGVVRSMPETESARPDAIERRDVLGGLIHEYHARAA